MISDNACFHGHDGQIKILLPRLFFMDLTDDLVDRHLYLSSLAVDRICTHKFIRQAFFKFETWDFLNLSNLDRFWSLCGNKCSILIFTILVNQYNLMYLREYTICRYIYKFMSVDVVTLCLQLRLRRTLKSLEKGIYPTMEDLQRQLTCIAVLLDSLSTSDEERYIYSVFFPFWFICLISLSCTPIFTTLLIKLLRNFFRQFRHKPRQLIVEHTPPVSHFFSRFLLGRCQTAGDGKSPDFGECVPREVQKWLTATFTTQYQISRNPGRNQIRFKHVICAVKCSLYVEK